MLPHDGKELTAVGLKAMAAGIPVVNLDRAFPTRRWRTGARSRATTTAWASRAGNYIGDAAQGQGRRQPGHRRDRRDRQPAADPGAQPRASRTPWRRTASRSATGRPADVHRRRRPAGGGQPAAGAAEDRRDVEPRRRPGHRRAGRDQAGQPQGVLHGRRRRLAKRDARRSRPTTRVLKATVTYSPSMASRRSRWPGSSRQGRGMSRPGGAAGAQGDHARLGDDHQGERDQYLTLGF